MTWSKLKFLTYFKTIVSGSAIARNTGMTAFSEAAALSWRLQHCFPAWNLPSLLCWLLGIRSKCFAQELFITSKPKQVDKSMPLKKKKKRPLQAPRSNYRCLIGHYVGLVLFYVRKSLFIFQGLIVVAFLVVEDFSVSICCFQYIKFCH